MRHGGGTGRLRVWQTHESLVCEIRDSGLITQPLVGRERPDSQATAGVALAFKSALRSGSDPLVSGRDRRPLTHVVFVSIRIAASHGPVRPRTRCGVARRARPTTEREPRGSVRQRGGVP